MACYTTVLVKSGEPVQLVGVMSCSACQEEIIILHKDCKISRSQTVGYFCDTRIYAAWHTGIALSSFLRCRRHQSSSHFVFPESISKMASQIKFKFGKWM